MEKKEVIISWGRRPSKTAAMKKAVEDILEANPNARVMLIGRTGKTIVTSENNTEIRELKQPKGLLTTPTHGSETE